MLRLKDGRQNLASIDFSPDGRFLAAAPSHASRGVKVFELAKPKQKPILVKHPLIQDAARVSTCMRVNFTADNMLIVPTEIAGHWTLGAGISVISWPDSELVYRIPVSATAFLLYYQIVNQRKTIVVPSIDEIAYWDIANTTNWRQLVYTATYLQDSIISSDMRWYTSSESQSRVYINYVNSNFLSFSILQRENNAINFSPSSRYLAFASGTGEIQIYSLESRKPFGSLINFPFHVSCLMFTPDDRNLLAICDNLVYIFDVQTGAEKARFDFQIGRILALKISDDGTMFAVSDESGIIIVVDIDF